MKKLKPEFVSRSVLIGTLLYFSINCAAVPAPVNLNVSLPQEEDNLNVFESWIR